MVRITQTRHERIGLMHNLSHVRDHIQTGLFRFLTEELGPLTEGQRRLAATLELIRIEDFIPSRRWRLGRPPKGRVPIIDRNPRWGKKAEMAAAERGSSLFKEGYGGRPVRGRGHAKVWAHVMFGLLALTAERLVNSLL